MCKLNCTEKKNSCSFLTLLFGVVSSFFLVFTFFSILRKKEKGEVEVKEKLKKEKPKLKSRIEKVELKKKEKNTSKLNERQDQILSILKKQKEIKMEQIIKKIVGISERTLRRDMNKLEELGYSKKVGTTKACKYIFVK